MNKEEIIETKQKIINSLNGEFEVIRLEKDNNETDVAVICEFVKEGKKGTFRYYWGTNFGIDYVRDYDEDENEDIYADIHDWAEEHFKFKQTNSLKYDGKEMIK